MKHSLLSVITFFALIVLGTITSQAQTTTFSGDLYVTASDLGATITKANQQVNVIDNGSTAIVSISDFEIAGYTGVSVTLTVTKDSTTGNITGYSNLSVCGVSGVKCKSVNGNITTSNCELILSLTKSLIRITVEFQSY